MQNLVLTQISDEEIRKLFREELKSFFSEMQQIEKNEVDEIGGIDLAIEITGLAKPTIYGLVSNRKIPHSKKGKRLYFSRKELVEWIANGKRKTQAEIATEVENYEQNKTRVKHATNEKSLSNQ